MGGGGEQGSDQRGAVEGVGKRGGGFLKSGDAPGDEQVGAAEEIRVRHDGGVMRGGVYGCYDAVDLRGGIADIR